MDAQMLYHQLAASRTVELERVACRARSHRDPAQDSRGGLRRRAGRLLIDVGHRLAADS